ncbi:helix-turn-helix domain-containing protein [Desulfococcus multivorans]|uniref:helix-turn-helix domain-containing protein n=1 Tax=Desulfococcus multivorans TaxID=897 RepID=UPI000990853D|nr:helix-turn-helix transcriptional regulator [Desulfococcus multivorans]AQU99749.1 hypothetical protein B2D07_02470 [Desulfococcus multivorans]
MIKQIEIAKIMGVHESFVSRIFSAQKRPSWRRAKQLAEITGTDPVLWLEGSADEIRAALSKTSTGANAKG